MNEEMQFTDDAWNTLYNVVDNELFRSQDADLIFAALETRLKPVSFGNFLKRYLYRKYDLSQAFEEVPDSDYLTLILDSFKMHKTPNGFAKTTARLSSLARNWLSQQSVNRKVVLLLGFGLGMNLEEVNLFLTKALKERGLNVKDPFELICWYCYRGQLGFDRFRILWDAFSELPVDPDQADLYERVYTKNLQQTISLINNDGALLQFLSGLKTKDNCIRFSYTAKVKFDELYRQTCVLVAELFNQAVLIQDGIEVAGCQDSMLRNDHYSDAERLKRIYRRHKKAKIFTYEDISAADIEHVICASIPVDANGNLMSSKASRLNAQFQGKRFNRQHINEVLTGREAVTRFDLITLNFFIFSQNLDQYENAVRRFSAFTLSSNAILEECGMEELYVANPYECFVLMCILSDNPLGTYADVFEKAYQG